MGDERRVTVHGLVDRLGGADPARGPERLRELLTIFYARLEHDPIVGFFFAPFDLAVIVEGQWGFLMRAFGAAERFHGRNPLVAHKDLPPILPGHFDRRIKVLREVLLEEGVDPDDVERWIKVENGFRRRMLGEHPE